MSWKFDEYLRNQKRTDAGRYLAIKWLSEKVDEQEKEIDELNQAKHLACKKSEYYRKIQERYHDVLHIIKTKTLDEKTKDLVEKTLYAEYEGDYVPCEYCPMCGRARR